MSNICGVIDCNNKLSTNEYFLNLSKDPNANQKSIFSKTNLYNTFVGICVNNNDIKIENIIYRGVKYTCAFKGEIYNTDELIQKIRAELGYDPMEIITYGAVATWCYILWGGFSPKMLMGKFAYSIYSDGIFTSSYHTPKMFIARDRFGFIPVYYRQNNDCEFVFSTSLGAILKTGKEKYYIDNKGFWQIFYLDGKSLPGYTLIKDVYELYPGCCAYLDCRDTCKFMVKSYDVFKSNQASDISIEKLLENSKSKMQICENTKRLEVNSDVCLPEMIDESVKTTHYPILPSIYNCLKNSQYNGVIYSDIGCELLNRKSLIAMKGFFPWISDPYANLDLLNNENLDSENGFDFINSYRLNITDISKESYYQESIYRFYLPMTLKHIESCADKFNISVKYPFCDCAVYSYLKRNGEIFDESIYRSKPFEFDFKNCINIKESEYAQALSEKLEKLSASSDSVINYLCDKKSLTDAITSYANIKTQYLLYATHSFVEEFCLDIMPCRDC